MMLRMFAMWVVCFFSLNGCFHPPASEPFSAFRSNRVTLLYVDVEKPEPPEGSGTWLDNGEWIPPHGWLWLLTDADLDTPEVGLYYVEARLLLSVVGSREVTYSRVGVLKRPGTLITGPKSPQGFLCPRGSPGVR